MEGTGFYILIGYIVWGCIWGWATKTVIYNKGYQENWFWWGFFFGFIALIVALTKQDVNRNYYNMPINSYNTPNPPNSGQVQPMSRASYETSLLRDGGWKCRNCNRVNTASTGTCTCGMTKFQSRNNVDISALKQSAEESKADSKKAESENLEILKKYKELLDMGAISQEEFDNKKQELLYETGSSKESSSSEEKGNEEPPKSWICNNCGKDNALDRKSCRFCGAIKLMEKQYSTVSSNKYSDNLADWKCPKCNTINKCYINVCKCGTSKKEGQLIK